MLSQVSVSLVNECLRKPCKNREKKVSAYNNGSFKFSKICTNGICEVNLALGRGCFMCQEVAVNPNKSFRALTNQIS